MRTLQAHHAQSRQTQFQSVGLCFLVSYCALAIEARASHSAAYARGGPFGFDRARAQLAQTAGITSRRAVSLPDASTGQEPPLDRSVLLPRARVVRRAEPLPATVLRLRSRCESRRLASQAPGRE